MMTDAQEDETAYAELRMVARRAMDVAEQAQQQIERLRLEKYNAEERVRELELEHGSEWCAFAWIDPNGRPWDARVGLLSYWRYLAGVGEPVRLLIGPAKRAEAVEVAQDAANDIYECAGHG